MSDFFEDLLDEQTANRWIEQNTPEWDLVRLGRFTSSEIYRLMTPGKREMTTEELKARPKKGEPGATAKLITDYSILSEAAITYINEKVAEVLTGQAKSQGYAFPIVWGKEQEENARQHFCKITGFEVETTGFYKYTDHAGGSPDGIVNGVAILECKCPYDSVNMINYLMLTDQWDVRRNYFAYWVQCQANMLFTGLNLAHFVAYDPRMVEDKHKMKHIEIKADSEFQDLIINQIARATKEKLEIINLLS